MTATRIPAPRPPVLARPPGLPPARRRRRRDPWDQRFTRAICALLALLGTLPLIALLMVRSSSVRDRVARETQRAIRKQGIVASYAPSIRLWPLSVELDHVRVDATDGGGPVITCQRALVRPKLFALLAGKIAIDEIDLDEPHLRAIVRSGRLVNLNLPDVPRSPSSEKKSALHAPFDVFSMTEGFVDLDLDGVRLGIQSLDLDATAEDDPMRGSTFEVAVRTGLANLHRPRVRADGTTSYDDDALCSLEARVRVTPDAILVRRLDGTGVADLDSAPDTTPACSVGADDKRRVELSLGHLHVGLTDPPTVDGHIHARLPIRLAERAARVPETDGWIAVSADVRYAGDTLLPDISGTIEAHDVKLAQYAFAHELHSEINVRRNVIESPKTTVALANGLVTLTDTVIDPLTGGGRLERTRLDAAGVDFTALMRDLGVHESSWVGWDVRELHVPVLSGTFAPLKLDGDFTGKTYSFGVYDRPADDPARERLFGFAEAQLAAHLSVRSDALKFVDVHARLPRSEISGAFVSIGFNNDLRVDVPHLHANLDDISPIGTVPLRGTIDLVGRVGGHFNHPEPEIEIKSALGFEVADVAFGDLSAGHVTVDTSKTEVDVSRVRAKRRDSVYDVPTAKLRFGGDSGGFVVDAVASSEALGLRDILSMFALDEDPRFDQLDATIATRADVHVALGGPEDACGGGYVAVGAKGRLRNVSLFGERFAQGDADVSLHWLDRQHGIAGADIDVRSFVLDKVAPAANGRTGEAGTVLGSATLRRGGALAANVLLEGIPLSRIDALGSLAAQVDGRVSGVAHVTGNLDDFLPDPGFVARAELDVAGTRVRNVAAPNSHLDVRMTQTMPMQHRSLGRTKCGTAIGTPFDKQAYSADTSSHGEWDVSGDLLGDTVHLRNLVMTRARSPHVTGRALLRGVDLGAIARIITPEENGADDAKTATAAGISGQLWGELIVDDLAVDALSQSRVRLLLGPTVISRGGEKLTLQPPPEPIVLANDGLTLPPLAVTLQTSDGFQGGFVVTGSATKVSSDPTLALEARLNPVDLAIVPRLVPKVERASGHVEGSFRISGRAAAPVIAGELHATGDDIEVRGLPSAVTDVRLDVSASANELAVSGKGSFAGGSVAFAGSAPIHGFDLGTLQAGITVRGVRLAPADGVAATTDADLQLSYDRKARGTPAAALPRLTGNVTIASLAYTRPITFNFDLASTRAKRTEVNSYDPALDSVVFDVALRSRAPIQIKNNLVEVQLGIDSGTIEVTGTNQRVGLRGVLRTMPGGRFHFQANDFEIQTGVIRFEDPTRIAPNVDVTAVTEYRRYTDSSAGAAAGAGGGAASTGSTRGGSLWRIMLHAYGDADNVRIEMTSEPALSQEDIALLLLVGMTRAELDQLQAGGIGESVALNVLGAASGADRAVKQALPIIDDFRFGSAYSTVTGKTEPQLTVGKRLTNDIRASVTAGLSEDRELRSNIEWRLNNRLSVQGSYDNINDVSSSVLGNLGVDLRWRLEFE